MESVESNLISRLGGVISVQIASLSSVVWFMKLGRRALVSVIAPTAWQSLPLVSQKTQTDESVSDEEGFQVTTSKLTIPLYLSSDADERMVKEHLKYGALLKVTFASGVTMVYGSKRHPLTGTVRRVSGTRHSESPYHVIETSSPAEGLLLGG